MTRLADRYLLDAPIGAGGAATVYRARDEVTGEWVAVKLAHRAVAHARFEREAAVLSVIASEHVVKVFAAGRTDGVPWVVMELLEGQDLEQAMGKVRSVAARDVVGWLRQAARALDLAHGVGLVHRDLKPSNLFLDRNGRLKVLDFGLVKQEGDVRPDDSMAGTPQYMAPEQVRGQAARVGPTTDVWAIGMIAVHLLTGEPYWRGPALLDVLSQIDSEPMVAPSTRWTWLPPAFDEWFARACHRHAAQRFPSVGVAVAALARAMAGVTGELVPSGAPDEGPVASTLVSQFVPRSLGRRLIGRIAEQRALSARLASGRPGLVTVTGPGGIGKSALAENVVAAVADRFPDGTFKALVDDAVAAADLSAALAQQAGPRVLVWLDAVDRVAQARSLVAGLRARSPGAVWLVTSRAPLELPDEERVVLAPLDLPAEGITPDEAARYDALALFTARAAEAAPGFALRPSDVEDAARVVRAAGGIPLAIELAASQLGKLPLSAVAARQQSGAPLQRALAGTLELLGDAEKRVLQALSVAGTGATATELRRLSGVPPDAPLRALVERGLVQGLPEEPVRWRLLPPVRELVLPDVGDLRRRWALLLAESPEPHRLDDATDALGWALGAAPDVALTLAAALVDVWSLRGSYAEGSRWLSRVLARTPAEPSPDRRRVLQGAGRLALLACGYDEAERFAQEAAAMARNLGDEAGLADADHLLGGIARERGQYGRAYARHEAARRRFARLGQTREVARAVAAQAFAAWLSGDIAAAARLVERVPLENDDDEGWVWNHLNRGAIALYDGRPDDAESELAEALTVSSGAGFAEGLAWSLELRGSSSLAAGDLLAAEARLRASLRVHFRVGDRWRCASVIEGLAATAARDGQTDLAALWIGAAEAVRSAHGMPVPSVERPRWEQTASSIAEERDARDRGRRTTLETVVGEIVSSA